MKGAITEIEHRIFTDPPLHVALYQPEIPANTGNIARLCGAAETTLHLIHPLGFRVDDRHLKRAGLDYWHDVDIRHHKTFKDFKTHREKKSPGSKLIAFSRHGSINYPEAEPHHGDYLLFGRETEGLPEEIRRAVPCYRIPIWGRVRSLNLSTAVGIVVYHYLYAMGIF